MRVFVLTFYFSPDLSAGAFRATRLVESLRDALPTGSEIDVATTMPNRYSSFSPDAPELERRESVTIHRIALPPHHSGMRDQSAAFARYARDVIGRFGDCRYDVVVATSSRLMTAALGAWLSRRANATLYLDLRDIFADTLGDIIEPPASWLMKPVLSLLERWAVGRAARVNLVSRGFATYFEPRYPRTRFSYFSNGVDDEFVSRDRPVPVGVESKSRLTVVYAGNIGDGQGLHAIVPQLAVRFATRMQFLIVGDGGRRRALERGLAAHQVTNVEMLAPMSRERLRDLYDRADVLFLHLNGYDALTRVLPSKIFEYAALGKPVWAGVAGHAAEFLATEVDNAAVFRPGDVDDAERSFMKLRLVDTPRPDFIHRYSRASISRAMARDILSAASAQG